MASKNPENKTVHKHANEKTSLRLDQTDFDQYEYDILQVSRLLFLAFHCPKSYAWVNAYYLAEQIFSVPYGSTICTTLLKAVNAACKSRNCGINYHDTNCEKCKEFLTDEEYYFIGTLHQIRQNNKSKAKVNAMLLCEGSSFDEFLQYIFELSNIANHVVDVSRKNLFGGKNYELN